MHHRYAHINKIIKRLLIANRGEPAMRAIHTCRELGIESAVIYVSEDASSDWVAQADYAFRLIKRGDQVGQSPYLDSNQIVELALRHHCSAIWPGWGFLSEEASFAEEVKKANLIWVGPSPEAMSLLGSKLQASDLAKRTGFDTIPEIKLLAGEKLGDLKKLRFPVVVKPAFGGGGKAQIIVESETEIHEAVKAVAHQSYSLYGNSDLVIQSYLRGARHIELQVIADEFGSTCILGARDCSIQRRNQKIIEEAPALFLNKHLFNKVSRSVIKLCALAKYTNAGTIEMLLHEGELYFLEVNTRLQVEHPVTEESVRIVAHDVVERLDILAEMLNVACHKPLTFLQKHITPRSYSIEARIYAENPEGGFVPTPGRVYFTRFPQGEGVRIDSAIVGPEETISRYFDPMIAKLIVSAPNREQAVRRLSSFLSQTVILGIQTNIDFLRRVVSHPNFITGDYHISFIADSMAALAPSPQLLPLAISIAAIISSINDYAKAFESLKDRNVRSLETALARIPQGCPEYTLKVLGNEYEVCVHQWNEGRYAVQSGSHWIFLDVDSVGPHVYAVRDSNGRSFNTFAHVTAGKLQLVLEGEYYQIEYGTKGPDGKRKDPHAAPYGGKLVRVSVKAGDIVSPGDELYVVEAMKMEGKVRAAFAGKVEEVFASTGDAIEIGDIVLKIHPHEVRTETTTQRKQVIFAEDQDEVMKKLFSSPESLLLEKETLAHHWSRYRDLFLNLPELYFKGFDISSETAITAFSITSEFEHDKAVPILLSSVEGLVAAEKLRDEDVADNVLDLIKFSKTPSKESPFSDLLASVIKWYGVESIKNREEMGRKLPRILLGIKSKGLKHRQIAISMIEHVAKEPSPSKELVKSIEVLLRSGLLDVEVSLREKLRRLLERLDKEEYYKIVHPPVAINYLEEYEKFIINPLSLLSRDELLGMRECVSQGKTASGEHDFSAMPVWLKVQFERWFEGFSVRRMNVAKSTSEAGVFLFHLQNEREADDKRLLAVGIVNEDHIQEFNDHFSYPQTERTAIEAYKIITQYELLGGKYSFNHVFIVMPSNIVIPWKHTSAEKRVLSPTHLKIISSRLLGFARGRRISATEVLLNLQLEENVSYHIVEIRHTGLVGLMNRPPYPMTERVPELAMGVTRFLDEKQQRLGKLLNRDRVRLLFDEGQCEELLFPGADDIDESPVGLKVYRGKINGTTSLCYAGDFRIRGGALGEREGKKLAATTVLAYVSKCPLVGIHDGAGADIRGSVASLGWAGAYFGALSNTGGFSSDERFWEWLTNHHEKAYFEKIFKHFGIKHHGFELSQSKYLHLHINLGAMVGMLVYGASISALSVMTNHPEVYRVLTGSAVVKKVIGESASNYTLGGARTHGRHSGDIDIVCETEEEAIECARKLLKLFLTSDREYRHANEVSVSSDNTYDTINRETIVAATDDGTFFETRSMLKGTSSLLTGYGSKDNIPIGLAASLSNYGIRNARSFKKLYMLYAGCQEFGLPLVAIVRDRWHSITEGTLAKILYLRSECMGLFNTLTIPRITVAIGPRSLDESIHHIADICVYMRDGTESGYDINRSDSLTHLRAGNLSQCMTKISQLILYLLKKPFSVDFSPAERNLILPANSSEPYDIRLFMRELFDAGSFFELLERDEQPLVVGFATLNGTVVGVIADDPAVASGAQTVSSLGKFTRFNRLCERFSIPLIEFNDCPAFQPGSRQERLGIQGEGGKSIREECLGRIPRLAVTLRQNYGGRLIHANLKTLGPKRSALICQGARVGVMGPEGALDVLYGKKLMAMDEQEREKESARLLKEYVDQYLNPQKMIDLGYADSIVPLNRLREEIAKWVRELE